MLLPAGFLSRSHVKKQILSIQQVSCCLEHTITIFARALALSPPAAFLVRIEAAGTSLLVYMLLYLPSITMRFQNYRYFLCIALYVFLTHHKAWMPDGFS